MYNLADFDIPGLSRFRGTPLLPVVLSYRGAGFGRVGVSRWWGGGGYGRGNEGGDSGCEPQSN